MVEWLAGNRIRGTSTERTSTTGFNPLPAVSGGWVELGRTTLGSKTSPMTVASLADKRYYMVLSSALADGTNRAAAVRRLGNGSVDTGSNYSSRRNDNGALENTNVNVTTPAIVNLDSDKTPQFAVDYVSNLSSKEKLGITHLILQNTAGAATAPQRAEAVWKWANTSNPLNYYEITREPSESGDWEAGSEVVVLGWDPADTHTTNFWEELASVDTGAGEVLDSGTFASKKYLWFQFDIVVDEYNNTNATIRFNSDQNGNYARRLSQNGMGTDNTATGQTNMTFTYSGGKRVFGNYFVINNSSSEKLAIGHTTAIGTAANSTSEGAGVAPRRVEVVGKWANTSSQITQIEVLDTAQGDLGLTSGTIKVWGSD